MLMIWAQEMFCSKPKLLMIAAAAQAVVDLIQLQAAGDQTAIAVEIGLLFAHSVVPVLQPLVVDESPSGPATPKKYQHRAHDYILRLCKGR